MKTVFLITIAYLAVCLSSIGQISRNITTNLSEIRIEKVGEYDKVLIGKEFYSTDIVGEPELPVYYQKFVIPRDALINGVSVNSVNKQKVKGEYNVFPAQQK